MNSFAKQIRLDLSTGETKEMDVPEQARTAKKYFASLNILNKSAPVYGVLYLATEEALNELA